VDGHQVNDRNPWVLKTTDYGRTWRLIVGGIPKTPLSYAHWVKEDPVRRGLLYLGTENALYVSFDDGGGWQALQNNLPHAPVHDITVQEHFNDLVVATYGRGFWILDDLTPLQQLTTEVTARSAHLFAPRAAYRFRNVEAPFGAFYDPVEGQNPKEGASLNYWLAAEASDSVAIRVLDARRAEIRAFKGPAKAGINRVYWDLRYEQSKEAKMRTSPLYAPEIEVPIEGRPSPSIGRVASLVPPGRYTIEMSAGDATLTQPLEVRKDPNTQGTEQEIGQQVEFGRQLTTELNGVVDMVDALEVARGQLKSLAAVLTDTTVKASIDSLADKLVAVEEDLVQLRITGRGQDVIRYPAKAGEKLVYLIGDVGSSDHAPTQSQRDVAAVLQERIRNARAAFDRVMRDDVPRFNTMLRNRGLEGIVTTSAGRQA
jgi:hypothetical protein